MPFANDCLDAIGVCPNRIKRVSTGQCRVDNQTLQIADINTGKPIDLSDYMTGSSSSSSESSSSSSECCKTVWCGFPNKIDCVLKTGVEIVIKETSSSLLYKSVMATIDSEEDAKNGIVHIPIDCELSDKAGIWLGMAILWKDGQQRYQYPFYFDVLPNLSVYNSTGGPIAIYEVRLAIRDVCPEVNFLIDTVEFKDEEIAWAIRRPVDYWNEAKPPLGISYSPMNFPYRYNWLNGTIGELLMLMAFWLRRNDLDYSAAGLTVEDTKKWPFYLQQGEKLKAEYKEWVKQEKITLNADQAWGTLGGYRANPYR